MRFNHAPQLAPVFSELYNKCLGASCLNLKSSSVDACFCKNFGEPSDLSNYCSISLFLLFCKVVKALINIRLVKHLTSHGLLSDKQYDFCFARSMPTC